MWAFDYPRHRMGRGSCRSFLLPLTCLRPHMPGGIWVLWWSMLHSVAGQLIVYEEMLEYFSLPCWECICGWATLCFSQVCGHQSWCPLLSLPSILSLGWGCVCLVITSSPGVLWAWLLTSERHFYLGKVFCIHCVLFSCNQGFCFRLFYRQLNVCCNFGHQSTVLGLTVASLQDLSTSLGPGLHAVCSSGQILIGC